MTGSTVVRFAQTVTVGLAFVASLSAAEPRAASLKQETFDYEPGWEAIRNRQLPDQLPQVVQNFGYRATNFAGRAPGELGGLVTRAFEPSYYADRIGPCTLDDKLAAAGTFAVTKTVAGGGLFFGFFRAEQPGGGGRPICSLGLHLDCERSGCRLAVRLITGKNQSCGTFVTPYLPGKFRPTPIRNDGTRYRWTLDYDPEAVDGRGRFTFTLTSDAHRTEDYGPLTAESQQEARVRFPETTTFQVDLTEGFRRHATVFDRFGLMNMMKSGGNMTAHFDDLMYDGRSEDFANDPHWDAAGNERTYRSTDVAGAQNFGFSRTMHAGGEAGEIGGVFWRTDRAWGRYADRVEPLSFSDRLEAGGKIKLVAGGPDADMCLGWFRTDDGDVPPNKAGEFLGVKIGGPTRVGHLFLPAFTVREELRGLPDLGPVLVPGKAYEWSIVYDPAAESGRGAVTATLGDESVTLVLRPGQKEAAARARFDRFGLFSIYPGGQIVHVYLDDLKYTARRP